MKFAVVGAGAIGAYLGAHLARSGEEVVLIARGPHLAAMRERGVRVESAEEVFVAHPECTDDVTAISDADVVFLTVKAHALPGLAPAVGAALKPAAAVLPAQNGIPFWYGERLDSVDPGGVIARSLPARSVIGCIAYPAAVISEPGVVQHQEGKRFTIGEPDGSRSERCQAIAGALVKAGLKCPISSHIRDEIWLKLLGNATVNPVSALTRAPLDRLLEAPETRDLVREMMLEVEAVARAMGASIEVGVEKRLQGIAGVGAHKTSMLQDVEAGRPLEVDALLGSVVELAGRHSVAVPNLRVIYALAKLLDQARSA